MGSPYVATPQPPMYSPYLGGYQPPVFRDDTELTRGPAPGPDRHSRRGRRSEGGHLLRKQLFQADSDSRDKQLIDSAPSSDRQGHHQQKKNNSVQIADDD